MADKKITALTALGSTDVDPALDLLHIIDYSASPVNKKITVANLFSKVNTDTHIYGATKVFEVGHAAATSALEVLTNTAASTSESTVTINNDQSEFVDFVVKSKQSTKAIHVDSSYTSGSSGPGIIFINGDAANQDFCVKGDNFSTTNPVIFSDASFDALGIGTNVVDGTFTCQVAADATTGHALQLQGNVAFQGVAQLAAATLANHTVIGSTYTFDQTKTVQKIALNGSGTTHTVTMPTAGTLVDGQIMIVMVDATAGTGTVTFAGGGTPTNIMGTFTPSTLQHDGDMAMFIYESTSNKWVCMIEKQVS